MEKRRRQAPRGTGRLWWGLRPWWPALRLQERAQGHTRPPPGLSAALLGPCPAQSRKSAEGWNRPTTGEFATEPLRCFRLDREGPGIRLSSDFRFPSAHTQVFSVPVVTRPKIIFLSNPVPPYSVRYKPLNIALCPFIFWKIQYTFLLPCLCSPCPPFVECTPAFPAS